MKNKPHVAHNSANNEWYTPPHIIEAARKAMGGIDTDPATSLKANEIVQAKTIYTIDNCGLKNDWLGNIWLNPPYARGLVNAFIDRAIEEFLRGNARQACILVNNATETRWFQRLLKYSDAVCFLNQRVRFILPCGNAKGAPLQGQVVVYIGSWVRNFQESFDRAGVILRP